MVQVQPETTAARTGGATGGGGVDGGSGSRGGGGDGGEQGTAGGGAHASALVSSTLARRGRSGSGAKEHQERRAKLLADLGDGTVLVSWANTGAEEVREPLIFCSLNAVMQFQQQPENGCHGTNAPPPPLSAQPARCLLLLYPHSLVSHRT